MINMDSPSTLCLEQKGSFTGDRYAQASLSHASASLSHLRFLAPEIGADGNGMKVELIGPHAGRPQSTRAQWDPSARKLSVWLGTNVTGTITATANEVAAAVNAVKDPLSGHRAPIGASVVTNGAGTVDPLAATNLAGGVDPTHRAGMYLLDAGSGNVGLFVFGRTPGPFLIRSVEGQYSGVVATTKVTLEKLNLDDGYNPIESSATVIASWEVTPTAPEASLSDLKFPLMPFQALRVKANGLVGVVRVYVKREGLRGD